MDKKSTAIILKCDCGCSMFVVEKSEWKDGDVNYNISVQDSRYDHNYNTVLGRMKSAFTILFGKPVYYSDVFIDDPEKYREFVGQMSTLCLDSKKD